MPDDNPAQADDLGATEPSTTEQTPAGSAGPAELVASVETDAPDSGELDEGHDDDLSDEDRQRVKAARSEARNLRSRLRDTEAERENLRTRLDTWQRTEATRIAADRANQREWALVDGADLWRSGVELADLLDDDGVIDEEKVVEAVGAIAKGHPHWCHHASRAVPALQPGLSAPSSGAGWSRVLRP